MASVFHDQLVEALPRMRAYALALTRNSASADDLLQETALKAWRAKEQFQPGTNFKAWLYRILRNEHVSTFRRAKRAPTSIDSVPQEFFAQQGDQESKALTREVFAAMDKLSRGQREVVLLSCASGLSYEEVAETLGCSMGTVKSRLWRARRELQRFILGDEADEMMLEQGGEEAESEGGVETRKRTAAPSVSATL